MLITHDMVDCSMLAGAELAIRRLHALETATARNPKAPNWQGLEHSMSTTVTEAGVAAMPKFDAWLASVQKDEAVVMKQHGLLKGRGKGDSQA